ncbi:NAD(P)H-dependent oxidoreductase [Actinoplanes sp. TBRC 11911]|uniref:NADPH-dependent FMN reductase n=1 Tax=Actinoplanes sp. TBRC 11911 TaxID=2729386 RepID=UPI00289D1076|nr:NAD(P)H-dependent oxidoreductase [Actinoplanes sp. TBRC 11911]
MSDLNLLVIVASTRPGRAGLPVSRWFVDVAKGHGGFHVSVADLAEENLPLLDEPYHPKRRNYQNEHTKRWSEKVAAADAFVFINPEYNYGIGAPLKNALTTSTTSGTTSRPAWSATGQCPAASGRTWRCRGRRTR